MPNITAADAQSTPLDSSPFGGQKVADQFTQFSVDPSQGLTRKRYGWYSNGTLFDSTLFSDVEAGIRLETTATGTDEARIRSAYPGQYISQALATPGLGLVPDAANVSVTDGLASLSHGEIYAGAFYWDETNDEVETGIGYLWDADGWEFFAKSQGVHLGDSPVSQADFGFQPGDGSKQNGRVIDPADGFVWNFPYTWYNEGPLGAAYLNPFSNRLEEMVRLSVDGRPSTDTPNLPVQLVVRNAGTAQSLGVELGGVQFTTYGAGKEDLERRITDETREESGLIGDTRALTENAIDPTAEPGAPLISFQRETAGTSVTLRATEVELRASEDCWVFVWDEYDPATALTGETFTDPVSPNNAGRETKLLTDTQATDYTQSQAVFRGMEPFAGGQIKKSNVADTDIDLRVPLEATRIYTAVLAGSTSAADVDPFKVRVEEGY